MATERDATAMRPDGRVTVWVRIEIEKHSFVKYEWDEGRQEMVVDRVLHGSQCYPFNYGEVLGTLAGDGDPLDAVVLTEHKLSHRALVRCKVIGMLPTTDEKGEDAKLIVVPVESVDPESAFRNSVSDVSETSRRRIRDFFESYKTLEPGKWVKVGKDFVDFDGAAKHVLDHVVDVTSESRDP